MKSIPSSVLFFGLDSSGTTSCQRANALRRLGCEVTVVNPSKLIRQRSRWQNFLDYRTGYVFLQSQILNSLHSFEPINSLNPDLVWVDSGELIGPRILEYLRHRFSCPYVLYTSDDPTGVRDGMRFFSLRSALSLYSLCVFLRPETSLEALSLGARRVLTVHFSYDENLHSPIKPDEMIHEPKQVVSFVGANIPGEYRDFFLTRLIRAGMPVRLNGSKWQKSKFWNILRSVYRGPSLVGEAYSQALGDASVTLGFLSHGNRDLVTRRSFETAACGGLFCAERTSEHQLLYEDGYEAVFWDSVDECILQSKTLLNKLEKRNSICRNGFARVKELGVGNEDICRQILAYV